MTAAPLSNALAKVRARLPLKIETQRSRNGAFVLLDKRNCVFCYVPADGDTDKARAELIRDAMNAME